jgi:hypothetical protein
MLSVNSLAVTDSSPPVSLESFPQSSVPTTPHTPSPNVSDDESPMVPSPHHVSATVDRLLAIHSVTPLVDSIQLTLFISTMTEVYA